MNDVLIPTAITPDGETVCPVPENTPTQDSCSLPSDVPGQTETQRPAVSVDPTAEVSCQHLEDLLDKGYAYRFREGYMLQVRGHNRNSTEARARAANLVEELVAEIDPIVVRRHKKLFFLGNTASIPLGRKTPCHRSPQVRTFDTIKLVLSE